MHMLMLGNFVFGLHRTHRDAGNSRVI